ncbi:hypothetical protein FRC96_11260 [Lujinxingia vulgaris]|uniref:Uncharacterized protein n=1 Tax=Lujinxingia vulgaris TaxID=2600176 RepID=A0A5C6X0J6_9DELT|nr:hypothetical protein [Lujinxingia vulgaris]TXD35251.1 hypothetical protein FRC96_11260 [Lujinxingia vulgaris]
MRARLASTLTFTLALLAAPLLRSAVAQETPAAERLELQTVSACADKNAADELRAELALRLPELDVSDDTTSAASSPARWRLFWVPEGSDRCVVILRTPSLEHRAQLGPQADPEAIREAASRLAWVITAARQAHSDEARTLGEERALEIVARVQSLGEARADAALDDLFNQEAARRTARSAASLANLSAMRTREVAEAAASQPTSASTLPPLPRPQLEPPGALRLGLFPGISMGPPGAPLTLNLIGSHERADGAQIGLINHTASRGSGAQIGLMASWNDGEFEGAQIASAFNYSRRIEGAQVAAVNVSDSQHGAQVGIVNIAGSIEGTQVGVVNISKDANWPVGLVNISTDYPPRLFGYYALPGHLYTGLSMGGRRLRYIFQSGTAFFGNSGSIGLGAGLHLPFDDRPYFADIEAVVMFADLSTASSGTHVHVRAPLGWRFAQRFALIAGPSLNIYSTDSASNRDYGSPVALIDLRQNNELLQIWVDLMVGVVF